MINLRLVLSKKVALRASLVPQSRPKSSHFVYNLVLDLGPGLEMQKTPNLFLTMVPESAQTQMPREKISSKCALVPNTPM